MRRIPPAIFLLCLFVAGPLPAEMLKYTDSQGRLRFVQDISQVPPEYRNQVEEQKLGRDISVTGTGGGPQSQHQRIKAMEKRSKRLGAATRSRRPKAAPVARKNPLVGAPAPVKYTPKRCETDGRGNLRCYRSLTAEWRRWDLANGGNNGKPVTRRRVGK